MWLLLALTSASFSAAAAVTQKKVLFSMPALRFSAVLAVVNIALTLPLFGFEEVQSVGATALLILFGKTILGAVAFLCVMVAIRRLQLSSALPMMVLSPGITAIGAWLLLGEALGGVEILGMLLLMAGTSMLELRPGTRPWRSFEQLLSSRGHQVLALALLLFAATAILDKLLLRDYMLPPHALIAWQHLFLAALFMLFLLFRRDSPLAAMRSVPRGQWNFLLIIGACTLLYRLAQVEAMALAPVALVLAVKRLSVLMATVFGGTLFREEGVLRKAIAVSVMLAGAALLI